ncbi:MAG: tetratricopeptide repeat protein, partial [Anaerolineales bacterium]|nr:tetratricopeptide repeat protein [Anaerolineales bacterium]
DAAYEMQLHAQRRELHQLAAESLEQLYAADLTPYLADLAYHYEQAHNHDKARHYLYQAGQQAQTAYQNNQAYDYFSRALALTPAADFSRRYQLLLGLEAIHDLQGNREQQRSHLNQLEQLATQLPHEESDRALAQLKFRFASYFFRIGDYEQAITMADEAIDLAIPSAEVEIAINSHLVNSQASWGGGYPEAAVDQAAQALQKAQTAGLARLEAYTLRIMGNIATVQGDYDNGYFLFEQALVRSRAVGFRLNEAECLNALGVISFFQGKYTHAAEYHTEGLAMRREMGDRMGEAKVIGNLGDALLRLGQMEHVANYLQRSLTMRQEVNDRPGEAWAFDKLGDLALFEENLTAAAELYQKALQIRTEIHAYRDQEWSMHNVGNSYRLQGEFAQAEQILQEALRISREINDRDGASLTHHQLGRLWHTQGDLAQAQTHYQQALEIQRELYNYAGEGMTLSTIALAHHQQGQNEEAAIVGRTALGIAHRIGYQTQIATAALLLGRIYLSVGQWATSADYLQQALTIRQQWPQPLHTAEVQAAQAHLALQQGQLAAAVTLIEQILPHLTNPNLTLLHEPTYLYWVSYQVLQATTDGRAAEVVQQGHTFLHNYARHLQKPQWQQFINN